MVKRHYNLFIIVTIVICVLASMLLCLFNLIYKKISNQPEIVNAELNVSDYNFSKSQKLSLDGYWEVFYDNFIISQNESNAVADDLIKLPQIQSLRYSSDKFLSASYRLNLYGFSGNEELYIRLTNFTGAYKIFVNNKLIASCGRISLDQKEIETGDVIKSDSYLFEKDKNYDIVIEASVVYQDKFSIVPVLAAAASDNSNDFMYYLAFIAAGMLVAIIIVCLILLKKERANLFLVLMFAITLIRVFLTDSILLLWGDLFEKLNFVGILLSLCIFVVGILFLAKDNKYKLSKFGQILLYSVNGVAAVLFLALPKENLYDLIALIFVAFAAVVSIGLLLRITLKGGHNTPAFLNFILVTLIFTGLILACLSTLGICRFYGETFFILLVAGAVVIQIICNSQKENFLKKSEIELMAAKSESDQAKISILLSQIKPHFLFNALNAIKYLYKTSPDQGESALVKFSNYLRANMNSITSNTLIYFENELEHIKNYAEIELIRFSNRLKVQYDIQEYDFFVPPLSIQPLIENAIKHGVCKKAEGGTVILRTLKIQNSIVIEVIDDGVGFDSDKLMDNGDFKSVGLSNIKKRLNMVSDAVLNIHSIEGKGTRVMVTLPLPVSKESAK